MKNLAIVCLILAAVSVGCVNTNSTTVHGVVMNYGKPVEGAEVKFGPQFSEVTAITGVDGKFELTVRHSLIAILRLEAKKAGLGQDKKIEFPGFDAPKGDVTIEMLQLLNPTR